MNCPACGKALSEMTVGTLLVDVCRGGCGGIWFDQLELRKVDDQAEASGEALTNVERGESLRIDARARRRCPKCPEIIMLRHFYGPKQRVEVDECGKCGGIWLDAGELAAIRAEYKTEDERKQAAHEFAHTVLGKTFSDKAHPAGGKVSLGSIMRFMWKD
jgi:hypothetical protein